MEQYQQYLAKKGMSSSTQYRQIAHIKAFQKWLKEQEYILEKLGYQQMIHYLEYQRQKGIGENTLVHYLRYLYIYFDYLMEYEAIQKHPLQHLHLRNQTRQRAQQKTLQNLLTEEELTTIYKAYRANKRLNKPHLNMLSLMIYQGIAADETKYLQAKHLDLEQTRIFVPSSRKHEQRHLSLTALQILPLSRYIQDKKPTDLLFKYANEKQATNSRTWLSTQIKRELRLSNQSSIPFKNLIQLRNSRISLWVSTLGLRKAQYLAGHRHIASTQRYKVTDVSTLKQQINQFHPFK